MRRIGKFICGCAVLLEIAASGCGGGGAAKQKKDFFTSGSREADQRADRRMAQSEQLKGEGGSAAKSDGGTPDAKKTLYERLGGDQGIRTISDDFIDRALADPRVNWQRKGIVRGGFSFHRRQSMEWNATPDKIAMLKQHVAQFIALASGGPVHYEGKEMTSSHAGLHITNAEFDASVGDLKATLDKVQVATKEQKELLAIIESTRAQVVEER